jgi:tetratricopeptide (TPR) repeat protein
MVSLGTAVTAVAQSGIQEREQEAGTLFERGVALYGEGSLDAALVQFERAYELIPNYRVLYNLAVSLYERYLEQGGDEIPEARRSEAREQLGTLGERVGQLWVETNVEGAKLFVDEELVGELPLEAPVAINAGVRRVRLEKTGFAPVFRQVKVTGGDSPRLRVPMGELAAGTDGEPSGSGARAQTAAGGEAGSRNYAPLWVASAATVGFGAAAITVGLLARGADRDLDRMLAAFPAQPSAVQESRSHLKTYAALTDGLAAVSVVSLGLSLYFLLAPPKLPSGRSEALLGRSHLVQERPRPRVERPRLSMHARGLGLVGSF